jgi:hypothetical protein
VLREICSTSRTSVLLLLLFRVTTLLFLTNTTFAQTKWYKFSKTFISSHYVAGNPVGVLAASSSAPAKSVHPISCGGKDGELHIGVEGSAIDGSDSANPVSGPADASDDKVVDFNLANKYGCNSDYCYGRLSAIPAAGNGVEGAKGFLSIPYAYALKRGNRIGPKAPFSGQLMASSNMGTIGQWLNVTNRYLGLKFRIKGKVHYGWARLNVQVLGNGVIKAVLTGYAYETIPNRPIIAGKRMNATETTGMGELAPPAAIGVSSDRGSLGMLAMGSLFTIGQQARRTSLFRCFPSSILYAPYEET